MSRPAGNPPSFAVVGAAYLLADGWGAVRLGRRETEADPRAICRRLEAEGRVAALPKNFGRFDDATLRTFAAGLWACADAGLALAPAPRRIGIVGSGPAGSEDANRAFFADYLAAGRANARGNLFIYTLPTTPLAETALALGLTGPLWFCHQGPDRADRLLAEAALCAAEPGVEAMLAVARDATGTLALVVKAGKDSTLLPDDRARAQDQTAASVRDWVTVLDAGRIK